MGGNLRTIDPEPEDCRSRLIDPGVMPEETQSWLESLFSKFAS